MKQGFVWDENKARINLQKHVMSIDDAEEYDFTKMKRFERGRYFRKFQQGYRVTIHKAHGSTEVRDVPPSSNIVVLDPDVQAYFPDSEAVNRALRGLLALVPH